MKLDHCFYTAVIFSWYPCRSSVRYRKYIYATSASAGLTCDPYWTCEEWWQVCQAPGQTAEHQFFIKQLQRNVLIAGSKTTRVPLVTMKPADVNPPAPALTTLLTHETIETIVLWSSSSNLSRRRLVLLVDSQRWFLYPLFLISKALSGTSTVPQRTCRKMTRKEFKESAFYEMERQRWVAEKKK
ncbi:hypothetical protein G5714_012752 [Onychostoma macrolepis]|uniref:Uncharacterized protein n=1 Tax=Onychostoma macrolepis TaxID=369639 RepID=A0A7J6CLT3_9TELE|nr:hypothetical protein G5714_012752 [Onychostoma macrolepis]